MTKNDTEYRAKLIWDIIMQDLEDSTLSSANQEKLAEGVMLILENVTANFIWTFLESENYDKILVYFASNIREHLIKLDNIRNKNGKK